MRVHNLQKRHGFCKKGGKADIMTLTKARSEDFLSVNGLYDNENRQAKCNDV